MVAAKIGKFKEQDIKLSDLEIDLHNPRTGSHADQVSAIKAMLNRRSTNIDEMADSIARNDFLTLELPCVYPNDNGKFTVAEGNRRITALKILNTPDLAHTSKKYSKFKELSQEVKGKLPSKIKCAVFKSARECLPYVLMRHGLGTDGASLKRWDALEKRRVDQTTSGVPHQGLKVIDFVLDRGDLSAKHESQLGTIKITTLERLTDSATVRKILEVEKADCTVSPKGAAWLTPVWQKIVEVILDDEHKGQLFNVRTVNTSEDQATFIHEILNEVHGIPMPKSASKTDETDGADEPEGSDDTDTDTKGKGKGKGKSKGAGKKTGHKTTRQRKGLIEKKFLPAGLAPQKIIDIVDELKKLNVNSHKNCAGVMFRVFTELSIEHYMKTHRIKKTKTWKGAEIFLSEKEKRIAVVNYMKDKNVLDARLLKALEVTNDDKHPVSSDSLNHYVHSSTQSPHADALKTAWSNLQHIFDVLWEK